MQRQVPVHECPAQDFIQGIVSPDIFPHTEQAAFGIKQARGMAAAGFLEEPLLRGHAVRQLK